MRCNMGRELECLGSIISLSIFYFTSICGIFSPVVKPFLIGKPGEREIRYKLEFNLRRVNKIVDLVNREGLDIVKWITYLRGFLWCGADKMEWHRTILVFIGTFVSTVAWNGI